MARLLVDAKAEVYARSADGKTPVDLAKANGQTAMIAYLIEQTKPNK
jgi:ankyrin repeat protein